MERDNRVLALFVTGSHADGRADEHSDLDLLAITDDTDVQDFAARLPALVNEIEPLVDAASRSLGTAALVSLVTEQCHRIDFVITSPASVAQTPRFGGARIVFDRAGIEATLPPITDAFSIPHGEDWFDALVKSVLRTITLLPMIIVRGEYIRGAQHVQLLKQDYLELLLFAEGDPPVTRPGVWAWSELTTRLSTERRRLVEALPPAAMTRTEVIDGHVEVFRAFLLAARKVALRVGFVWKHAPYERAVADYLSRSGMG